VKLQGSFCIIADPGQWRGRCGSGSIGPIVPRWSRKPENDTAARDWLQRTAEAGNSKARALLLNFDQNPVAATVKKTADDKTVTVVFANGSPDFS
jgi:hypothetical protein